MTFDYKNIEIKKSELKAKTQFLIVPFFAPKNNISIKNCINIKYFDAF